MKPHVGIVSIKVKDQDRAKAFFMDNFGWVCTADAPMGDDNRWVSVAPSEEDGQTNIQLSKEDGAGDTDIIIECDDVVAMAAALKAKGVEITEQPRIEPWGGWAEFKDSEGNEFGLHHSAK